jgi:glycosyltransferase involved in cell wall biosynthesis
MLGQRSMHVVIVDEELPYPPTSGKRIRILNLVKQLAKRHKITMICHRNPDPEEARQAQIYLADLGTETVLVDRKKTLGSGCVKGPRFCARMALNLFSSVPYSVQWNRCPQMRETVQQYAAEHTVDLWQCEWAPYATALMGISGAPWVMMAHDIQSFTWERYYRSEANPLKRWYIKKQWDKYRRYEARVFSEAHLTITVTEEDERRAREHFSARRTAVVDNGVDVAYYQAPALQQQSARKPSDILFLGSLEWRPNLDAARILLTDIFPLVLAEVPTAKLCIVGRRPPKWLVQLGKSARNVEIHADVPDVRPFLYRCGAMAVPLRIGGGSRLKILEALATDLPVVSTKVGAEGLHLRPGSHFAEADSAEDMARVLVGWIRNPQSTREMVLAGRRVVENQYDWSTLAGKMERAWQELLDSPNPRSIT